MKSKRKRLKVPKKHLMYPVFKEDNFRSETGKETDEVILFASDHIWWTLFSVPSLSHPFVPCLSSPLRTRSFCTVVLRWEGCEPLQPIQPAHVSYMPSSVLGPGLGSPGGWIRGSLCLQSVQRPQGEVVKPPVLTSSVPEAGSEGSGSPEGRTSNWGYSCWSWKRFLGRHFHYLWMTQKSFLTFSFESKFLPFLLS